MSLSNSTRIESVITQQRFSKISLIKIDIVNNKSYVINDLTSFYEDVEFLKIMIFIDFRLDDFKMSFSSHVLLSFNQQNVLDLINVSVLDMHEKNVNERKSILVFLFFYEQNLFNLLSLSFDRK